MGSREFRPTIENQISGQNKFGSQYSDIDSGKNLQNHTVAIHLL